MNNKLNILNILRKLNLLRYYRQNKKIKYILNNSTERDIFIETGTYFGDTISSIHKYFNKCYTIEVSKELYNFTKKKYKVKNNIVFINGDSGYELNNLILNIEQPIVYWLDSHYSGGVTEMSNLETSILLEIEAIIKRNNPNDVIFIDDYKDFGRKDYPSIELIKSLFLSGNEKAKFKVCNNIFVVKFTK